MCIFTCGFVLQYLSLFQTKLNVLNTTTTTTDNHGNIQKDTILLFEVGQAVIQTINQRKPLFK